MNFEGALPLLRDGKAFTRQAWKDKRQRVTIENDEGFENFYKVGPCRVAHYTHAKLRYNPTPNDILANDWVVI